MPPALVGLRKPENKRGTRGDEGKDVVHVFGTSASKRSANFPLLRLGCFGPRGLLLKVQIVRVVRRGGASVDTMAASCQSPNKHDQEHGPFLAREMDKNDERDQNKAKALVLFYFAFPGEATFLLPERIKARACGSEQVRNLLRRPHSAARSITPQLRVKILNELPVYLLWLRLSHLGSVSASMIIFLKFFFFRSTWNSWINHSTGGA